MQNFNGDFSQLPRFQKEPVKPDLRGALLEWRTHMCLVRDCLPEDIASDAVIEEVLLVPTASIFTIHQAFQTVNPLRKVRLEIVELMLGIIKLYEQNTKTSLPELQTSRCDKDLKGLLREIGWDQSFEWLNRTNDKGIKLYKEIISVDEFDLSIAEECESEQSSLTISEDVTKALLKCAEYFRKGSKIDLQRVWRNSLQKVDQSDWTQQSLEVLQASRRDNTRFWGKENAVLKHEKSETSIKLQGEFQCVGQRLLPPPSIEDITNLSTLAKQRCKKEEIKKNKEFKTKKVRSAQQIVPSMQDLQNLLQYFPSCHSGFAG